jgi:hypothetical protein
VCVSCVPRLFNGLSAVRVDSGNSAPLAAVAHAYAPRLHRAYLLLNR